MLLDGKLPIKYIIDNIRVDLFKVLFVSILSLLIKVYFSDYLPKVPIVLASVLGTSISLLLAFKLNQAYDRWWEARKIWGSIVNDSRTLVLQLKSFIPENQTSEAIIKKIAYRQIAWCYSLGQSLRKHDPLLNLEKFISSIEMESLKQQSNKPLYLLYLHSMDIKSIYQNQWINDYQQIQLDNTITRLCDSMGRAERINTTVFPAAYRKYVHFFIYLFIILLSIALVETIGFYEIPVLTLISSTFLLIEKSSSNMQEPFSNKPTDTAVTTISRNIEINLKQLLHETDIPSPIKIESFYIM